MISFPLALLALTMSAADSGSADSMRTAVMDRLDNGSVVRITTAGGQRLGHATVTPDGLDFGPTSFRGMQNRSEPDLVAWSEMKSVEIAHTKMSTGAAIGLVVGILASAAWIEADPPKSEAGFLKWGVTAEGKVVGRMLFGAMWGTLIGGAVGSHMRTWERVQP